MKIMYVPAFYMPDHEYRENYYPKYLKTQGHVVKVVTSDLYYHFNKEINGKKRKDKIRNLKHLDEDYIIRKKAFIYFKDKVLFNVSKEIKSFHPDIIHIFEATQYEPLITAFLAHKMGINVVYEHEQREFGKSLLAKIDRLITPLFLKKIVQYSTGIRVLNEEALDFLKRYSNLNGKKISISTLGYNPKIFFFDERLREETRRKLALKDEDILAIVSGKNLKSKRVDLIIKALSKYPNVKLIIIGSEEFTQVYKALSLLSPIELNAYYNAADLCIWTRYTVSYFQALGTGCQILIPKTPYTTKLSTILPENIYTFEIYPSEGHYLHIMPPQEIVNNIRTAFEKSRKKYRSKERKKAAKKSKEYFSWYRVIKDLESFYYDCLK